ncbi:MAG: hypothetical protein O7D32_11195 [bacterium]|nr:hypothetical protein [bacterium]
MQNARTLTKDQSVLTPYFVQINNPEIDSDPVYQIGGLLRVGVGDRLEWQLRFDRFSSLNGEVDAYGFISLAPKIAAVEGKLAFIVPLGAYSYVWRVRLECHRNHNRYQ